MAELYRRFNEETEDGRQMGAVSALLDDAINSIIEVKEEGDIDTLNIAAGELVAEVAVFLVQLTGREVPEVVLRQIDKEIPYHILFLLEFEVEYQACIGYKTLAASGGSKIDRYYHTDWLVAEDLPLQIAGLDMDAVYENLVRQIAGERLQSGQADNAESLQEAVEREKQREQLKK